MVYVQQGMRVVPEQRPPFPPPRPLQPPARVLGDWRLGPLTRHPSTLLVVSPGVQVGEDDTHTLQQQDLVDSYH